MSEKIMERIIRCYGEDVLTEQGIRSLKIKDILEMAENIRAREYESSEQYKDFCHRIQTASSRIHDLKNEIDSKFRETLLEYAKEAYGALFKKSPEAASKIKKILDAIFIEAQKKSMPYELSLEKLTKRAEDNSYFFEFMEKYKKREFQKFIDSH